MRYHATGPRSERKEGSVCPTMSVVPLSVVKFPGAIVLLLLGLEFSACEPKEEALPPGTSEAAIGPVTIAGGQERTVCITMRLANESPILATRISPTLAAGSHHLILYRSADRTQSLTPTT